MIGDNKCYCHTCNQKTNSTKQIHLVKYPYYLNITLKMFGITGHKLPYLVSVPFHLNLISNNYLLLSAIVHLGCNSHQGHYTQFSRSISDAKMAWRNKTPHGNNWAESGEWIYTNDEIKRKTSVRHIKTVLGHSKTKNSFECVYNATFIRMQDVHGIAIPKMPNIQMCTNEPQFQHVTIDDWEIDDENDHNINENKSEDEYDFVDDNNCNNQQQCDNDWSMINLTTVNTMQFNEQTQDQDIQMIQSTSICNLPPL